MGTSYHSPMNYEKRAAYNNGCVYFFGEPPIKAELEQHIYHGKTDRTSYTAKLSEHRTSSIYGNILARLCAIL